MGKLLLKKAPTTRERMDEALVGVMGRLVERYTGIAEAVFLAPEVEVVKGEDGEGSEFKTPEGWSPMQRKVACDALCPRNQVPFYLDAAMRLATEMMKAASNAPKDPVGLPVREVLVPRAEVPTYEVVELKPKKEDD